MQQIDPCRGDVENSLEDYSLEQDNSFRTANPFHVKGDDKYTRSVQCIVFMITGGRIHSIREMSTDEFGLRSMEDIDQSDLRIPSKMWGNRGLVPMGKLNSLTTLQYTTLIFQMMAHFNIQH
jgi:hypothetical protein